MFHWCVEYDVQAFHGDNLNGVYEKMINHISRLCAAGVK